MFFCILPKIRLVSFSIYSPSDHEWKAAFMSTKVTLSHTNLVIVTKSIYLKSEANMMII